MIFNDRYCSTGSVEDIIFTGLGAKIEKMGEVVSADDDLLISVFVKLPNNNIVDFLKLRFIR